MFDHAAREGLTNQIAERLRGPLRRRESVRIPGTIHLVRIDTLLASARRLYPPRLACLACGQVALIPTVVPIPTGDMTQKENIEGLGRERQTKAQDLSARQIPHCPNLR